MQLIPVRLTYQSSTDEDAESIWHLSVNENYNKSSVALKMTARYISNHVNAVMQLSWIHISGNKSFWVFLFYQLHVYIIVGHMQ